MLEGGDSILSKAFQFLLQSLGMVKSWKMTEDEPASKGNQGPACFSKKSSLILWGKFPASPTKIGTNFVEHNPFSDKKSPGNFAFLDRLWKKMKPFFPADVSTAEVVASDGLDGDL